MKFIHFIDAETSETVLNEGINLKLNHRKINLESSGIFCYPLIKIPFKTPVDKDENHYLWFKREENILNKALSMEESWEVVGASRVTRRNSEVTKVSGVIFEISENHFPMTVFMNIGYEIANEFAQILDKEFNQDICYKGYKNSLLETLERRIDSKKYVIASAPFTIYSEEALLDLISKLQLAGGGIWKEDSFECMLTENVLNTSIEKVIELENRYYKHLA